MNISLLVNSATQKLIDHVEELTILDQAIGDGDHGLNMKRGSKAIQDKLAQWSELSTQATLTAMGKTCIAMIGGASGPVFGTLLLTLGKELPEQPDHNDLARALRLAIEAVTRLGKAEIGQKTLLDVLDPLQKCLAAGGESLVARAKQCALDSCEATAHMEASRGRSSFLGERALGHIDPGSRSVALIVSAICDAL